MRRTLFKWMRDIVDRKILGERNMDVLFLACEIFDKFVSIKKSLMSKGTLETFEEYGITCLMLSIKGCMDCDCHGFTLEHAAKLANSFPTTIRKFSRHSITTLTCRLLRTFWKEQTLELHRTLFSALKRLSSRKWFSKGTLSSSTP